MNSLKRKLARRNAFTLVEVLLVIVIIGMIAGIALPQIAGNLEKARIKKAKAEIASLSGACDVFEMDCSKYPATLNDLVSNPGVDGWEGPYMKKTTIPKDPWAKEYSYSSSNEGYEIKTTSKKGVVITSKD